MIAKGKSIAHGQAMTNYTTKNERATIIKTNQLNSVTSYMGMWAEMELHQQRFVARYAQHPIKNTSMRFEISPSALDTYGWTNKDWEELANEFVREMDSITSLERRDKKTGKKKLQKVKPTNIADSQYFVALHRDSKSGIAHLHLVCNRIDHDGNVNNDAYLGERAVKAAAVINSRRGWADPLAIRQQNLEKVSAICMDALKHMRRFTWDEYRYWLAESDCHLNLIHNKEGVVKAYTISYGNSVFKASELGVGRNLTVANIESTFRKLHSNVPILIDGHGYEWGFKNINDNYLSFSVDEKGNRIGARDITFTDVEVNHHKYQFALPNQAYNTMCSLTKDTEGCDCVAQDILNVGVLLFLGYFESAIVVSESHGGGEDPGTGWRDRDDDDELWARRCAANAKQMCQSMSRPIARSRGRRK